LALPLPRSPAAASAVAAEGGGPAGHGRRRDPLTSELQRVWAGPCMACAHRYNNGQPAVAIPPSESDYGVGVAVARPDSSEFSGRRFAARRSAS
ncbi:MAG: hypothetical protein ABSG68_25370, partial [Thermoguttaceae bacterium]